MIKKKVEIVPVYDKPIKYGDKKHAIPYICRQLQKAGSTIKIHGVFNIGVRSAVVAFQKRNGLKPTGVVDKKTWNKLVMVK